MNTKTNYDFRGMQGVLVHSDRMPSVQQIQEAINRYQYPCKLDDYGLEDNRSLFSGRVFGCNAYARFRAEPALESNQGLLEPEYRDGYDLNIGFDLAGTYSNRALAGCCMLGIAEMSGGVIWQADFNRPMNKIIQKDINEPLARLKLLKAAAPYDNVGVVSAKAPELGPWETTAMRNQAISEFRHLGLIEPVPDEADVPRPWCFSATELGRKIAWMSC